MSGPSRISPSTEGCNNHLSTPHPNQSLSTTDTPGLDSTAGLRTANRNQTEHFSLRTWIRNAPWKQYFKSGCRLIVKSPFNFFIFFCCLSVVVWGAFLVLLLGNAVKLADEATKLLWIEIASQVLNGLFTLANVPVHPKRFIGFVRGFSIWKENRSIRRQFVDRFLKDHVHQNVSAGSSEKELGEELLRMLEYYRCFPEYGRCRTKVQESPDSRRHNSDSFAQSEEEHSVEGGGLVLSQQQSIALPSSYPSPRLKLSIPDPDFTVASDRPSNEDDGVPEPEHAMRVDIAEDVLNELLSEETHRVVHCAVLPFLPFPLDVPDMSSNANPSSPDSKRDPLPGSDKETHRSQASPRLERRLERGSSFASLSRVSTRRSSPRTRARTMSMVKESGPSTNSKRLTFLIHENGQSVAQHLPNAKTQTSGKPLKLAFMPAALTDEQMDWVDERQERLLKQQERLQKAWPWYHYTIPAGIEPVDFFAPPDEQPTAADHTSRNPIILRTLPMKLVMRPARFCVILGLFNLNSMIQEVLCGFMWGMSYHVRPGWVIGVGTVLGFITGILATVLIVMHETAMSRIRVVATTEEAIQDVIDEKQQASYPQ
ncbi:hypothetical protein BGX34_006361 [Mortierella sp. NVP85]|nr:hypothetical protein BGX34_006361 [Mortierella sp. NVP85]